MSVTSTVVEERSTREFSWVANWSQLTRPRIGVMTVVAVAASGLIASWGQPAWPALTAAMIGVLLVAASASAMNQWIERHSDALMPRTASRPLASGRLSVREVLLVSLTLFVLGEAVLWLGARPSAAAWSAATWLFYVFVYTPLKRRTSLNTAVGAIAGAMPVCIGWSAVGGAYDLRLAGLFTTLYLWQFPHFMAIAWLYRRQYERAQLQMLTVVDPTGSKAGWQAVWTALFLIPVSCVPVLAGPSSGATLFATWAFVLGAAQFACASMFFAQRTDFTARLLLAASLIYLPTLLGLLVLVPLV